MIRILHVVGKMHRAGQETITMNIYRALNRDEIQFDFLVHTAQKCDYDDEIERLGGHVYHVEKISHGIVRYVRSIRSVVREQHFDIVHLHTAHSAGFFVLLAAKLGGARVRIAHSRNNSAQLPWLHYMLRPLLCHFATHRFACSSLAGRWMFGKRPFRVLKNAIDTRTFAFSEETRRETRAALGLGDELTLGHVGRFNIQKNHRFLLDIMKATLQKRPDATLLLAGDGELMPAMKARAEELGIAEHVRFLGSRPDIPKLMQAMDVFVFPSLFEGFGNVMTEAQTTGLPCVAADTLTRETRVTEHVCYLSLRDAPETWAEAILSARPGRREDARGQVADAGFDVSREAIEYAEIYRAAAQQPEEGRI